MAFFDDLKDKASDAAVVAGKAMSDVYEVTRLKMSIAEKKGAVKTIFKEVGELVYNGYRKGETDNDEIEEKMLEIDSIMEEIESLKEKQMKIKKLRACPACGSQIPEGCNFCPKCGNDMGDAPAEEAVETVTEVPEEAAPEAEEAVEE